MNALKYLSVCSGIEAATVAWHNLGWQPIGFSEIEPFPSEVLAHHYPDVENFGDMTKFKEWNCGKTDLLVGGTPCQSFSVAGLRAGLDDPRGNLALVYCSMLEHFQPRWFVWENVPGVLSSNKGRDFGAFLGAVAKLGYGFAYRVLDAQYFGVAQRRRRVFVVGYLGDWRPASAVLFERQSLCRNIKPSRKTGQEVATSTPQCFDRQSSGEYGIGTIASTIAARDYKSPSDLIAEVHDSSSSSLGDNMPIMTNSLVFGWQNSSSQGVSASSDITPTLDKSKTPAVMQNMAVRRLTPIECERLQGFPDNYTQIAWRNKASENCPDSHRYKALGNSMAVPIMHWIGRRIQKVNDLKENNAEGL